MDKGKEPPQYECAHTRGAQSKRRRRGAVALGLLGIAWVHVTTRKKNIKLSLIVIVGVAISGRVQAMLERFVAQGCS